MMYAMSGHGFPYGLLIQLLVFIAFFIVVWWVVQKNSLMSSPSKNEESPSDILKSRLANGDISLKEYRELKKEIE